VSGAVDQECLFCRIVARDVPADILHISETVVAFRDIDAKAPTHILLVPTEHLTSVAEIEDRHARMLVDIFQTATHLARTEGIDRSGWRLITNVGPDSGQAVFHLHFHLLGGRHLGALVGEPPPAA
jgi:histidine triad (HIT) family protein